ncbi:MAG: retroviral-like aspartic protease family protein [Candidatus Omnitrophica bacterium]|nr:retroviral-like aspartic protease family protein [Candidatus Omnitrophota bacterium]
MVTKLAAAVIVVMLTYAPSIIADTIILKNGEEIVGNVVSESGEGVVVSKQGGSFVYSISKNRIKNIRKSTPGEEAWQEKKEGRFYKTDKKNISEQKSKWKEYRLSEYKKEVIAADRAQGRMRVHFTNNKFGVVDVVLNDKIRASLFVDTGASFVSISEKTAGDLKIDLGSLPKIKLILANGSEVEGYSTTLDSVEVGNARIENVKIAIHKMSDSGKVDGLLGMSFLKHFHVKLDSQENCLILEKYQ